MKKYVVELETTATIMIRKEVSGTDEDAVKKDFINFLDNYFSYPPAVWPDIEIVETPKLKHDFDPGDIHIEELLGNNGEEIKEYYED